MIIAPSLSSTSFMIPKVEVRREVGWAEARVLDVDLKTRTVLLKCGDSEELRVPGSSVRKSVLIDTRTWEPIVGEEIEVRSVVDKTTTWSIGRIRSVKGEFYFVNYETSQTVIVEKEALRPVSVERGLNLAIFDRYEISFDKILKDWIQSNEALGIFSQVCLKANLLHVGVVKDEIVLIGEEGSIRRGKLLLEIHLKHQRELQYIQERKSRKQKYLEERDAAHSEFYHTEFSAPSGLVGLIIGKAGSNIQKISRKHEVEIQVLGDGLNERKVRISGPQQEMVEAAREDIEYIFREYKVSDGMAGWILGKRMHNLDEWREKSGVFSMRFRDNKKCIEIIGLKRQVEDALILLDSHAEYFHIYQSLDKQEPPRQANRAQNNKKAADQFNDKKENQRENRNKKTAKNGIPPRHLTQEPSTSSNL